MSERTIVPGDEWLYRRSWPGKKYMNPDGSATSRVFKLREKDNGELSVNIKSLTTPETTVIDPSQFLLYEIHNKVVEENNLSTWHDPLPENKAHAVIIGMDIDDDIIPGILARRSIRVRI
ncbi:MAG TPA: hypothetical protein PKL70_13200 [Saprospiraceae bacterium]|nr:hypothetical protein [Saprospiraceae bacterium]